MEAHEAGRALLKSLKSVSCFVQTAIESFTPKTGIMGEGDMVTQRTVNSRISGSSPDLPAIWAVVKIVDGSMVGCMVGPFKTKHAADDYAEKAGMSSLGYEKWIVRVLQKPNKL